MFDKKEMCKCEKEGKKSDFRTMVSSFRPQNRNQAKKKKCVNCGQIITIKRADARSRW